MFAVKIFPVIVSPNGFVNQRYKSTVKKSGLKFAQEERTIKQQILNSILKWKLS